MEHKFGGLWTQRKIEILRKYLAFYTTALKDQPFTLHYADAFAGTGSHIPDKEDSAQEALLPLEALKGSVTTALDIEPGFHRYHFNDIDPEHIVELERQRGLYPAKHITITRKDANEFVPSFCNSLTGNDRAVLFIDPYSSQLNWDTLKAAAASQKVDVWLLFPLSVILRMTSRDADNIKPEWSATLERLLGTNEWQQSLYKPVEKAVISDMFTEVASEESEQWERVNWLELQRWVTERLRQCFPFVSDPVPLKSHNRPLFSFYFLVSNPKPVAWSLAEKVVKHILKNER